jgi:hypothetical protein
VLLRSAGGRCAFKHLLHQIDAATWAIKLIAQQLVGRTSGGAKTAVHAFAQNGFGRFAFGCALVLGREIGLHKTWALVFTDGAG